jgi:hypothetical protein
MEKCKRNARRKLPGLIKQYLGRGFLYLNGNFDPLPEGLLGGTGSAFTLTGLNDNNIAVGTFYGYAYHGFVLRDGNVSFITYPNASYTAVNGVNNHDVLVGTFVNGRDHRFRRNCGDVVLTPLSRLHRAARSFVCALEKSCAGNWISTCDLTGERAYMGGARVTAGERESTRLTTTVLNEIEVLRRASVAELRARYCTVFGEDTHSRHSEHLFRKAAWRAGFRGR